MNANYFQTALAEIPNDVSIQVRLSFDIADKIAASLKSQGLTQKDLAQKMNKSESEVSRWMSGTHNFKLSTLAKISNVLGIQLIYV